MGETKTRGEVFVPWNTGKEILNWNEFKTIQKGGSFPLLIRERYSVYLCLLGVRRLGNGVRGGKNKDL